MRFSFETDTGRIRKINQDCCMVFCPEQNACFGIVCDGMGGAKAGEIASSMAMETVSDRVKNGWREGISEESVRNLLLTSVTAANINVYDSAVSNPEYEGMGTTIVACAVVNDKAIIVHAGDSRAYLFSEGLRQLTKDHSYVQMLVDNGKISDEEALHHPQRNYITRALGIAENIQLDFSSVAVKKGDLILLCSDGLTNYLTEREISSVLERYKAEAAKELVACANSNGGGDNISAVVIACE